MLTAVNVMRHQRGILKGFGFSGSALVVDLFLLPVAASPFFSLRPELSVLHSYVIPERGCGGGGVRGWGGGRGEEPVGEGSGGYH